jgi:BirA family biotin operon repressor/biotin-[acetyl-CoA-carboxylase] ligase
MIVGSKYIFLENLSSTNSCAAALLKKQSLQEGTVIYTNYQTAGRGQAGNSWESEPNKNLLISLILYPHLIRPIDQFIISKTISLGICDFLKQHITNVFIKWPNYIYVMNDKIAGILIETSVMGDKIESVIAGIGLNVNQKKFRGNTVNPVSLAKITGKEYEIEAVLSDLASQLNRRYEMLLSGKKILIDDEYISNLYRYNSWHEYRDSKGDFKGRIVSVNSLGQLQIEDSTGEIHVYGYKEVNYL